jgi:PIN domain nuclease of toxin-antitoxin system
VRILLDTHAFLWWLEDHPRLTQAARQAIANPLNVAFISAATVFEIVTKHRLGKLPGAALVAIDVARTIAAAGFVELPIRVTHAQHAGSLAGPHKDPFDRMLIAQALTEAMALVSNERQFDAYGINRLW